LKKRKEIEVSVPARIEESGFGCPHVVTQLQKSVGDSWSRISSANALQKGRSGSSERGPSSERGSAGETAGSHIERRACRESASPLRRERSGAKTQGGERSSFSGRNIAKSGAVVAGPGPQRPPDPTKGPYRWKASRIVTRRQLSREGVNGGLGGFRILRPVPNLPKEGRTASLQHLRRQVRREDETEIATGVSEARSRQHRGKKTPTLVSPGREAVELEFRVRRRSAEAVLGRRETSCPPVIPHGALVSVGRPRSESCESEPGTREVRVHAVRLSGRNRLDASRVFSTGRSQGLLVIPRGR